MKLTPAILELAQRHGMSQCDVATLVGCKPGAVSVACKRNGIKLPNKKWAAPAGDREFQMRALYESGKTLEEIGQTYGVTRERVRQLLTNHFGIRGKDGGKSVLAEARRKKTLAKKDARTLKRWGCSWSEYVAIRDFGGKDQRPCKRPTFAYHSQRRNARSRGIGWDLTLAQWWAIWQTSGKWAERGRGQGYVMCREGDEGPYALGNVFIATARENSSNKKTKRSGLPMGVTKAAKYNAYLAHRCIHGKIIRLGSFPTPELAHAAYLAAAPTHSEAA